MSKWERRERKNEREEGGKNEREEGREGRRKEEEREEGRRRRGRKEERVEGRRRRERKEERVEGGRRRERKEERVEEESKEGLADIHTRISPSYYPHMFCGGGPKSSRSYHGYLSPRERQK